MHDRRPLRCDARTRAWRGVAFAFAGLCGATATLLLASTMLSSQTGVWGVVCVALIFATTLWLAWGAAQSVVGLWPGRRTEARTDLPAPTAPTVVLVPICNEDPTAAAARIAAMESSCRMAGVTVDFAILSDTRDPEGQAAEQAAFATLLEQREGRLCVFYRVRSSNHGRKAGNIEDFVRRSGGAYDLAVILDADSLMEGVTIGHLISRMQANPEIGLLQTLPKIIGANSFFGRAMQFAASFYSPVFARGLQRLQGSTGPFWGHNAIVRMRALAQSCGLPELSGPPPFGGTVLSHDYVEAALLARGGWRVEMDPTIEGSFEEGPDNLVAYARRDRRWCQGNLQHLRLLTAPGLAPWSRFVFLQGIAAYLVSILWAAFLIASVVAMVAAPAPDYFPESYQLFPVFPDQGTRELIALAIGIGGLLLLPKLAILLSAGISGRTSWFGGTPRAALSVLSETLLSSLIAPLMLMYQSRAVVEVFAGRDGGWPVNLRGEGRLSLRDGWQAGAWISTVGVLALGTVTWIAPALIWWLLPVTLPMIAAPFLISWTSRPASRGLFTVLDDHTPFPVVQAYRHALGGSVATDGTEGAPGEPTLV